MLMRLRYLMQGILSGRAFLSSAYALGKADLFEQLRLRSAA